MIEAIGITKSFGALSVLKGVNLKVEEGEIVALVGVSGAGKSTLLQIMGTLEKPDGGSVLIDGKRVNDMKEEELCRERNRKVGFVFQSHQLLPAFTALENVMMPALIGGVPEKKARKRAIELLERVQLSERLHHKPASLSGGECQRVAIARALINNPKIVLADEPSGSLDSKNRMLLHTLFLELRKDLGQSFLIATHDEELSQKADRILRISDGIILD
ncbi:MAG TPA: lipoprotein-releasing system ATP-binding protein LolD [Porphyromonadaceae bacterium]|nr:lipoprotein-releasing system ATP-binding protein LolD [Porphyromonadaceae bacterium]